MIFKHGMWLSNISSTTQVQILLWPIRMMVLREIKLTFHTWMLLGKKDMEYDVKMLVFAPKAGSLHPLSRLLPLLLQIPSSSPAFLLSFSVSLFWFMIQYYDSFFNVAKRRGNSTSGSCTSSVWGGRNGNSTQKITLNSTTSYNKFYLIHHNGFYIHLKNFTQKPAKKCFFHLWASMDPRTSHNEVATAHWLGTKEFMIHTFPFIYPLTVYWLPVMYWALWVNRWMIDNSCPQVDACGPVRGWAGLGVLLPALSSFVTLGKLVHLFVCQFSHP